MTVAIGVARQAQAAPSMHAIPCELVRVRAADGNAAEVLAATPGWTARARQAHRDRR
jgi:hypothetical protein